MPTIFEGLGVASSILHAQQTAISITQRNISNANTEGYSRQRVAFSPSPLLSTEGVGAPSISVETFRDRFIDYRISREVQDRGKYQAGLAGLEQVESLLNENAGAGLEKSISEFYDGWEALANAPEDMNLRETVLSKGGSMAREFHRLYERIQSVQLEQDRSVADAVDEINALTSQLAQVNGRTASAAVGQLGEPSMLHDERQVILDRLAALIDISYYETESGQVTATTKNGSPLVIGIESHPLQAVHSATGPLLEIELDGKVITSGIESGKLGGLLQVRDRVLPGYLGRLDRLAAGLIASFNAQHSLGSDYNGLPGGNFFSSPVPGPYEGAAHGMSLVFSDPKLIAAAESGAGPGSNANARRLSALRDAPSAATEGLTPQQYYSRLIYSIGADMRATKDDFETQDHLLVQLQNQRDALAGVNLDEEALNIIRYQRAYEASARLVRVWDEISEEILNVLGG